jgi:hypothetical protein
LTKVEENTTPLALNEGKDTNFDHETYKSPSSKKQQKIGWGEFPL